LNKAVIPIFLILTTCGTPQNKQVIWIHPNNDAYQFEADKAACENIGLTAAGQKPAYTNIPRCGGGRRGLLSGGSSCISAQDRARETNRKNKEAWLSSFESAYNACMFDKGYKLQTDK